MKNWSAFVLAVAVALVFALIGLFYLVPDVYHPFSADTYGHTTAHLTIAAVFLGLDVITLILGGLLRPSDKS
jgi:hypothetical protein